MTAVQTAIRHLEPEEKGSHVLDVSSFEHVYKTSYSHGLEKIYALENIDIRSVRKIYDEPIDERAFPSHKTKNRHGEKEGQLHFDFSTQESFPFAFREPIHVLGLAKHLVKKLHDLQKNSIRDLVGKKVQDELLAAGIAQAFVEDIQEALESYLEKAAGPCSLPLDLSSWLRSFLADLEPIKAYIILEPFQLSHLIPLTSGETSFLRKMNIEKKRALLKDAFIELRSEEKEADFMGDLKQMTEKFLLHWVYQRKGMTSELELRERFLSLAGNSEEAELILLWFKNIYCQDKVSFFPMHTQDKSVLCVDQSVADLYQKVVEKAKSYFYKGDLYYFLRPLVLWIRRECAKDWLGFSEGFVERALRLSSQFRVRKISSGELVVKLAIY